MTDATFTPYTVRCAAKSHRCHGCASLIRAGESYERQGFVCEGKGYSVAYHPDCRSYEFGLNQCDEFRCDDYMSLHEFVGHYGERALVGAPASVRARFHPEALGDE